jgi:hypothetical protein
MEYQDLLFNAIALVVSIMSGVWFLSTRLERVRLQILGQTQTFCEKFKHIEIELTRLREAVDEERDRRAELWNEVNSLRERVAKMEVRREK